MILSNEKMQEMVNGGYRQELLKNVGETLGFLTDEEQIIKMKNAIRSSKQNKIKLKMLEEYKKQIENVEIKDNYTEEEIKNNIKFIYKDVPIFKITDVVSEIYMKCI